jgi:hypothetical protein
MATITVNASDIQSHLDDDNVDIIGFEWNKYHGSATAEFEVSADLTYEDDDYVDLADFEEVQKELEDLRGEYEALEEVSAAQQLRIADLEVEAADLETTRVHLNKVVADLKAQLVKANTPWYKKF